MPTASPSISARIGAVVDICTKPDTMRMPAMPTPTPIRAVSSGSPAATTDPNVMSSTISAMTTPSPSVEPTDGICLTAAPDRSTVIPSTEYVVASRASSFWVSTGTSVTCPRNMICAIATLPSGEIAFAVVGSTTVTTEGRSADRASMDEIAWLYCGSVMV